MLANIPLYLYTSTTMKKLLTLTIIALVVLGIVFFDQILVFLLSGLIPGTNFSIPPTTMLAVMVASAILVPALRYRHEIYENSLDLYDAFFGIKKKKDDTPSGDTQPELPRRRYQEL